MGSGRVLQLRCDVDFAKLDVEVVESGVERVVGAVAKSRRFATIEELLLQDLDDVNESVQGSVPVLENFHAESVTFSSCLCSLAVGTP